MEIGGRYTRDREIGRGGMGAVWLGHDEVLGRPVAIKRVGGMPGGSSPDLLRAEREARIAASLNHPNVVGVYDLVYDADQQWLVMEYVEGTTLSAMIHEQGPIPVGRLAPLLAQAAQALAAAHAAGIVHRDVKPSNILVRGDGEVKISDFGIARAMADAALTQTGLVTGSPAYLAPEIAEGRVATPASDVWSLGATMYHALAGKTPYDVGDNVLGALYRIVNEPPPRLSSAGALGPLLEVTMTRNPDDRVSMADVAAFVGALPGPGRDGAAAASPPPTPAPPPTAVLPVGGPPSTPPAQSTQALPPVPREAAPPASPPPSSAPPAPRATPSSPRRRGKVLPTLIALVVVALVAVIVALALSDDPQSNLDPGGTAGTGSASDSPSPEPSESQSPSEDSPDPAAMEQFVRDYLATVTDDPQAAFGRLTPAYQDASPDYEGFWGPVTSTQVNSISADPDALTVSYTYTYVRDGRSTTENVTLQLVQDGDGFLIDGAS